MRVVCQDFEERANNQRTFRSSIVNSRVRAISAVPRRFSWPSDSRTLTSKLSQEKIEIASQALCKHSNGSSINTPRIGLSSPYDLVGLENVLKTHAAKGGVLFLSHARLKLRATRQGLGAVADNGPSHHHAFVVSICAPFAFPSLN